jgi:hypothetical protein
MPQRGIPASSGNVDLYAQPKAKNPDGTISTVDSRSYSIDGKEVLLPSVTPDGRHLKTDAEIIAEYRKTGRHLGKFNSVADANAYATQLHNDYAAGKYDQRPARRATDMPRKVRGPDGIVRIVPDDATDEQIAEMLATIDKEGPSLMAPKQSMVDQLTGYLPAAGGTVGGIVGGTGGTVLGMGVGGVPGAIGGATLGGGLGEALKQLIDRARGIKAPGTMTEAAKDIGVEGGIQGAMEAGGAAASKYVIAPAAKAVMRGYLKPSLAGVKIGKAREIVQTALDEALPVTKGGEERAGRLITDLNKQINGILASNPKKVDLHQVAEKVRTFAKAKYFTPGVDDADYQAALAVADSIDKHASLGLPPGVNPTRVEVSASEANKVKQNVRPNSRAFGQQGSAPEAATRKVAGAEMRKSIEGVAPEVGQLNAREGKLIDAQDAIKRAAGREENKGLNPTAVPNLISGAIAGEEYGRTRDPASSIAWALATRAALSPAIATRIAIKASQIAKNGYAPAAAARMAMEFFRSETEPEPHGNPHAAK